MKKNLNNAKFSLLHISKRLFSTAEKQSSHYYWYYQESATQRSGFLNRHYITI